MSRPNVVVICADDLGHSEIGVYQGRGIPDDDPYGGQTVHTPRLDSLARDGVVFGRYYVTSAICSPSRYSLLTGRLASRSPSMLEQYPPGTPASIQWNERIDREEGNIAKVFKAMGYATGFVGKWHNGNPKMDFRGVDPAADPRDPAIARIVKDAYDRGVAHLRDGLGFDFVERVYFGNKEYLPPQFQVHNQEWIAEGALKFIDGAAGGDDPFFLYMAFPTPHGDQLTDFVNDDPCITPSGVLANRPEGMPAREDLPARLGELGVSETTAMATWIDDTVGVVLDRLDALGVADDTIVVFTVDHLAYGKYMCYEGSRVPTMVRWPGHVPAGGQTDVLCANTDWVATLTALVGGTLPEEYPTDGVSFADALLDPAAGGGRKHVYLESSNIRGVVTDRWKYIASRATEEIVARIAADKQEAEATGRKRLVGWDGRVNPHAHAAMEGIRYFQSGEFPHYFDLDQLYDLAADPWEQTNLIGRAEHAETVAQLKATLGQELRRLPHTFGEFTA